MSDPRVITHAMFVDDRAGIDPVVHEILFDDDRFVVGELLVLRYVDFAIEHVQEVVAGPGTLLRFVTLRADPGYAETSYPSATVDDNSETKES